MLRPLGVHPFDRFAGTSVGAINATFLASNAADPDLGVERLVSLWRDLHFARHVRVNWRMWSERALLDVGPFHEIIRDRTDWRALARHLDQGRVAALFVAALHVDSGRTTVFADLAPTTRYAPSPHPQRITTPARITADHVLASAAIPGIFPPQTIDGSLYYDGGLRFNTPMAPAIRSGARRLVVVTPLHQRAADAPVASPGPPDAYFLAGKMMHAVLLDPFAYDLQVLQRINGLLESLEDMGEAHQQAFSDKVAALRGAGYRRVDVLSLSPSRDLGECGLEFLDDHASELRREGGAARWLGWIAPRLVRSGTDLASYLLFDGRFTGRLADLGRQDTLARADEVRDFFTSRP